MTRQNTGLSRLYPFLATALLAAALLLSPLTVRADDLTGGDSGSLPQTMREVAEVIQTILQILMALGALVSVVFISWRLMKGDREGVSKVALLLFGLILGFLSVTLFSTSNTSGGGSGSGGLSAVYTLTQSVLLTGLSIVLMIAGATHAIKIAQGDTDSVRKLFWWIIVGTIGITLLKFSWG